MIAQHYFTHCEGGLDTARASFQTLARSPDFEDRYLHTVMQYCRYDLSSELRELGVLDRVSADDLRKAPVVLHSYHVDSKARGITRVGLAAPDGGRPGNFFAHSVVFESAALKDVEFDPFVVERSLLCDRPAKQGNELPTIASFSSGGKGGKKKSVSHVRLPWKERKVRVSALMNLLIESKFKSPILVRGENAMELFALFSDAFRLLPPGFMEDCTVSTMVSAEILNSVEEPPRLAGTTDRLLGEARGFRILDLSSLTGEAASESRYASYVLQDENGSHGRSRRVSQALRALELEKAAEAFDGVLPAVEVLTKTTKKRISASRLAEGAQALVAICQEEAAAGTAFQLLWRHLGRMRPEGEAIEGSLALERALQLFRKGRLKAVDAGELSNFLAGLLTDHQYGIAVVALDLSGMDGGDARGEVLRSALNKAVDDGWLGDPLPKLSEEQTAAFQTLCREGLGAMGGIARFERIRDLLRPLCEEESSAESSVNRSSGPRQGGTWLSRLSKRLGGWRGRPE